MSKKEGRGVSRNVSPEDKGGTIVSGNSYAPFSAKHWVRSALEALKVGLLGVCVIGGEERESRN